MQSSRVMVVDQTNVSADKKFNPGFQGTEISQFVNTTTADQTSVFDSKFMGSRMNQRSQRGKSRSLHQRSQFTQNVTQNKKFEIFLDAIFQSKMPTVEIKDHIVKYVQALETSYTEVVRELKDTIEKEKGQLRKVIGD